MLRMWVLIQALSEMTDYPRNYIFEKVKKHAGRSGIMYEEMNDRAAEILLEEYKKDDSLVGILE